MADLLKFELVSPERLLMSNEVQQVTVPGTEGDFGVFAGHAPVLSTMRPGVLDIVMPNDHHERIFVRGGFAEVNPEGLTILAEDALAMDQLDRAVLIRHIDNAKQDVADANTDEKRQKAQEMLDHLEQLLAAL
ncbi:MAG TPA: F0F1 ATP synthase subunit epsilon [Rhizobiales bacterium]|nr:F0F1 ATP synthase subunit epsilon [Hyphomicrobiales bacterium]